MSGKGSFLYSLKAVLCKLNPLHVIAAALIAAALFIGVLIAVVKLVVSQ
jgi:hypothetical protein